jgi:tRNA 2-(methylsulfanyl)-N6-isopentenyladenosine37 hydroxylase
LHSNTPAEWAHAVLKDPVGLLRDHALLEMKAAQNAMELMGRCPGDFFPAWVATMTGIARDETAHLAQVTRVLMRRGGHLTRGHRNPYAKALRELVRNGTAGELIDRLLVSALIEVRSCERFGVLAAVAAVSKNDDELRTLYQALFASEFGHYKAFLKLAYKIEPVEIVDARWHEMLREEARILAAQTPGPRMHSGV